MNDKSVNDLISNLADDTRYRINKISKDIDPLSSDRIKIQNDIVNKLHDAILSKNLNEIPETSSQMLLFG